MTHETHETHETHPTTITADEGLPFVTITRDFDASPELLFRAWTEPDLVVRWLGPRDVEMRVDEWDATPGGRWAYTHTTGDGVEHGFRGVFHTLRTDLLVQTFEYLGAPDAVCLESIGFESHGATTTALQRSVFPSVEARDAAVASGMEHGIRDSMDRLAELVSTEAPA